MSERIKIPQFKPPITRRWFSIQSAPILAGLLMAQCLVGILSILVKVPAIPAPDSPFGAPSAEFIDPIEQVRQGPIVFLATRFFGGLFTATLARRRKLAHVVVLSLILGLLDIASTYMLYREIDARSEARFGVSRTVNFQPPMNESDGEAQPVLQAEDRPQAAPPSSSPGRTFVYSVQAVLTSPRNWLNALAVILGGVLVVAHETWRWRIALRNSWKYVTREGLSIPVHSPPADSVVAWAWILLGIFLLATCWVPLLDLAPANVARQSPAVRESLALFVAWDILRWGAVGIGCCLVARRFRPLSVEKILQKDIRPPVVFLRSFDDDGRLAPRGLGINYLLQTLLHRTAEGRLARFVTPLGPFIAIGRPGETLPDIGAARMYVADEHWKAVVQDLAARAGLVIFQAGQTGGLQWELKMVMATVPAKKVLVFLPAPIQCALLPWVNRWHMRRRETYYQGFSTWAEPCLGMPLPEKIGDAFFLVFAHDKNDAQRWKLQGVLPGRTPRAEDSPARKVLVKLSNDRVFRRPHRAAGFFRELAIVLLAFIGSKLIAPRPDLASQIVRGEQGPNDDVHQGRIVYVNARGELSVDDAWVSKPELSHRLSSLADRTDSPSVVICGEEWTNWQHIMDVMDLCQEANISDYQIAVVSGGDRFQRESDRVYSLKVSSVTAAMPLSLESLELMITVNRRGEFSVNGERHTESQLSKRVRRYVSEKPGNRIVVIRGDGRTELKYIERAMRLCKEANIEDYFVAVEFDAEPIMELAEPIELQDTTVSPVSPVP